MLPDRVGRRLDLEVVAFEILRQFVGMAELDAFARSRPEEERLLLRREHRRDRPVGTNLAVLEIGGAAGQDIDAGLRVVPAGAVGDEVELHSRNVIASESAQSRVAIEGAAGAEQGVAARQRIAVGEQLPRRFGRAARIGEGRPGLGCRAVHVEIGLGG